MTITSSLVVLKDQSVDMRMLIVQVIRTKGDLLQVMYLLLQVEKLVGCQSFKKQLRCPLPKKKI